MKCIKWCLVAWAIGGGAATAFAANEPARVITEHDLFHFQWIGDPQISASSNDVAYVVVTVDDKRADYETALFRVSAAGNDARRLTSGKRDSSPR